jgi:hypothetical protein
MIEQLNEGVSNSINSETSNNLQDLSKTSNSRQNLVCEIFCKQSFCKLSNSQCLQYNNVTSSEQSISISKGDDLNQILVVRDFLTDSYSNIWSDEDIHK